MNSRSSQGRGGSRRAASMQETGAAYGAPDAQATQEIRHLSVGKSQEEIRQEAQVAEAGRSERFRDRFEGLATVSLYLAWLAITVVALAWLYHLLIPDSYHWLSADQRQQIQAVLTGVIAAVAVGHLRKRLYD